MTQPFRIALAGLGTVGTGVLRMLDTHGPQIAERAGRPIEVVAVSARSRSRDRGVDISAYHWMDDPVTLATGDGIDCLVEVMGGEDGPAKAAVEAALDAGRHVVTANKAMLARHGTAMAARAEANGAALRFEAAVAGGIPVVKALGEGLVGNAITRVLGVMNGTCNYILTEMARTGADYADVLAEAQRLGYAEADPEADVGGFDAAHKLALLAAIAFGTEVDFDGVEIDGIHRITLADIRQAADMGYRIKLLGVARMNADGLEQRMQPCLVPAGSALGQLDGVTNAVAIEGDFIGQIALEGPGAGAGPTASAILGDLVDIARGVNRPALGRAAHALRRAERSQTGSEAAYYLRLALRDAPGTLARVATCLGEGAISIDMMRQYGHRGANAPVVIVTHPTSRAALSTALRAIQRLDVCSDEPVALRIEPE